MDLTLPVGYDPVAARPKVVLHHHLSDAIFWTGNDPRNGLVRPDNGDDLLTVNQLVEFLIDAGCPAEVVPVVNPDPTTPSPTNTTTDHPDKPVLPTSDP